MALTPGSVKRTDDSSGDDFLTFTTAGAKEIQALALVDEAGDQAGIPTNPTSVSEGDGDNVAIGATTDAAVITDTTGTLSGKMRGLVALMVNFLSRLPAALGAGGGLKVDGSGTALPISGTVTVQDGGGAITVDGTVAVTNSDLSTLAGAVAATHMQADIVGALPAGTNNIGDVDVASIAAGENVIGLVGASDTVITVTPTCDTNAYSSGDLLFDSTEIANAVRANGYCAILESITITDKGDQKVACTLLFANAATDFGTLNSAPDPDDTEAATVIGCVSVVASDYIDLGGASVACIRNIGLLLKAGAATTSLYVAAVNGTGTPTYGASDLVLQIGLLRS